MTMVTKAEQTKIVNVIVWWFESKKKGCTILFHDLTIYLLYFNFMLMMKCVSCVYNVYEKNRNQNAIFTHHSVPEKNFSVCTVYTKKFIVEMILAILSFFSTIHFCYLCSVCRQWAHVHVCVSFFDSLFNGRKFLIWHSKWWMYAKMN